MYCQWQYTHVGHGTVKSNCFPNSTCFINSETDAAPMASVTVRDLCVLNDWSVMRYFLHKPTPVMKESILVLIEIAACGFALA